MSRTDIIKLVAGEVLEQMAGAVERADEAVALAQAEFDRVVRDRALTDNAALVNSLALACRFEAGDVVVTVPRSVYADGALPIDVPVTLTNTMLPFERRMMIEVRVPLFDTSVTRTRGLALQQALRYRVECARADDRVSVVKESVRKDLVAELLKGPDGEPLLAAAKTLAALVKARMLQGGE